ILGMGDILSLIERAQEAVEFDEEQARRFEKKLREASFDLEDFLTQLRQVKKMGPLSQLLEMIPGMNRLATEITPEMTDGRMRQIEAIISSMTPAERRHPEIINASRKRRIARGSGTSVQDVNMLLHEFRQMQRMMKQLSSGRGRGGLLGLFGR
ncbi:MAG: signal recognition particle protein, partial [Chloroflexota bacterium]